MRIGTLYRFVFITILLVFGFGIYSYGQMPVAQMPVEKTSATDHEVKVKGHKRIFILKNYKWPKHKRVAHDSQREGQSLHKIRRINPSASERHVYRKTSSSSKARSKSYRKYSQRKG